MANSGSKNLQNDKINTINLINQAVVNAIELSMIITHINNGKLASEPLVGSVPFFASNLPADKIVDFSTYNDLSPAFYGINFLLTFIEDYSQKMMDSSNLITAIQNNINRANSLINDVRHKFSNAELLDLQNKINSINVRINDFNNDKPALEALIQMRLPIFQLGYDTLKDVCGIDTTTQVRKCFLPKESTVDKTVTLNFDNTIVAQLEIDNDFFPNASFNYFQYECDGTINAAALAVTDALTIANLHCFENYAADTRSYSSVNITKDGIDTSQYSTLYNECNGPSCNFYTVFNLNITTGMDSGTVTLALWYDPLAI